MERNLLYLENNIFLGYSSLSRINNNIYTENLDNELNETSGQSQVIKDLSTGKPSSI